MRLSLFDSLKSTAILILKWLFRFFQVSLLIRITSKAGDVLLLRRMAPEMGRQSRSASTPVRTDLTQAVS